MHNNQDNSWCVGMASSTHTKNRLISMGFQRMDKIKNKETESTLDPSLQLLGNILLKNSPKQVI